MQTYSVNQSHFIDGNSLAGKADDVNGASLRAAVVIISSPHSSVSLSKSQVVLMVEQSHVADLLERFPIGVEPPRRHHIEPRSVSLSKSLDIPK